MRSESMSTVCCLMFESKGSRDAVTLQVDVYTLLASARVATPWLIDRSASCMVSVVLTPSCLAWYIYYKNHPSCNLYLLCCKT